MNIWIDKETLKRVNIQCPYKGYSRLDTAEIRERAGLVEIQVQEDPEYSDLTHYRDESDNAPYVLYRLKSQAQIVQALNALSQSARTAAYLGEIDPLFFKEQRGEVPAGTWLAAVQAVKEAHPKYPEVIDD